MTHAIWILSISNSVVHIFQRFMLPSSGFLSFILSWCGWVAIANDIINMNNISFASILSPGADLVLLLALGSFLSVSLGVAFLTSANASFNSTIGSSLVLFLPLFLPRLEVDVVTSSAPLTSLAITSGSTCSGVAGRRPLLGRGGVLWV